MVARALIVNPKVIIAHEPVSMIDASLRATVLTTLRELYLQQGISILYITHDLATAYQIIVMYAGHAVETGSAEEVIKWPKHPYSQLLINALPQLNPEVKWQLPDQSDETNQVHMDSTGCKFAGRCQHVMEHCVTHRPDLVATEPDRSANCHLYDETVEKVG